ncbi:hypothetical protein SAMN05444484_101955 [Flavobacterium chilense]|uniref:Uncharacterized protein n=1 Tax=Flavobacterium chilense TaxID=946677 RepID=A0A1M6ZBI4_9FLAO|nr:hypothetical protein SAMN05444484_101955 [Flavobacterium chilense]
MNKTNEYNNAMAFALSGLRFRFATIHRELPYAIAYASSVQDANFSKQPLINNHVNPVNSVKKNKYKYNNQYIAQ